MDVRTKKVLYISYDGMTDQLGQSQVIPYIKELTKTGYSFTILSVEKKERLRMTGKQIRTLLAEDGIEWNTLTFTTRPPLLSKAFDQWKLNTAALSLHMKKNFDMVHCRSYVPAAAGLKLSKRFGIPFLFDMRGFWVDERVDCGLWKIKNPLYKFLYKLYKKKERKYFSLSAHIISLTHKGKDELINAYQVPAHKISVIPCCTDMDHFDYRKISEEQKAGIRQQLNIDTGDKVLSYLGSLGGWYMTDEMLDFFSVMKKKIPGSKFLFITKDRKEYIVNKAIERGIDEKDILVQPASRNEVPVFLSVSDWSIFFIKDVYSKKASSPTKQGEIMAMGIPLLCNDIGDTGRIVKASGTGALIENFDRSGYEKLVTIMNDLLLIDKNHIRQSARKNYDLHNGVIIYNKAYRQILL
jgi:glycosyltransferase involved in cell wall biosynthesis